MIFEKSVDGIVQLLRPVQDCPGCRFGTAPHALVILSL